MAAKTHVEVSFKEKLLILQGYEKSRCNWQSVLQYVRENATDLPEAAASLYKDSEYQKIKRRMSDQVKKLTKTGVVTENAELNLLIGKIQTMERRYSQASGLHPQDRQELTKKLNNNIEVDPAIRTEVESIFQRENQRLEAENQGSDDDRKDEEDDDFEQGTIDDRGKEKNPIKTKEDEHVEPRRKRGRDDVRKVAIPDEQDLTEAAEEMPKPAKRKSTSDLAREAYESFMAGTERGKKLEDKMERCMDKFLSM